MAILNLIAERSMSITAEIATQQRIDSVQLPTADEVAEAGAIYRKLAFITGSGENARLKIYGEQEETSIDIPLKSLNILVDILRETSRGKAVQIVPHDAVLTTQEAAQFLNVSRPYLIKLLEEKKIPFYRTGNRRQIAFQDLQIYKQKQREESKQAMNDLAALSQEAGFDF